MAAGIIGLHVTGRTAAETLDGIVRAQARGVPAVTFSLAPVADAGVSGTAALAALDDGATLVALAVVGLEPGAG
jgi:hypothetical protein